MMYRRVALIAGAFAIVAAACTSPKPSVTPSSARMPTSVRVVRPRSLWRPADFSHPLVIDNTWTPMIPGTASYFAGTVNQGKRNQSHGIISIITDLSKVIDGVRTAVVWERDFSNGVLAESELFFVAQDNAGTVWLFGEYPAIYEHGRFTGAPDTWISGVSDTHGGIFMPASPQVGTPSYSQGRAPSVQFYDRAQVSKVGQNVCGTFACHHDVLVIEEWSPLAPQDGHQLKYYAPGLGTVLVRPKGGNQQETLSLVNVAHLNARELAATRQQVRALDAAAYHVSKAYAHTAPAMPRNP